MARIGHVTVREERRGEASVWWVEMFGGGAWFDLGVWPTRELALKAADRLGKALLKVRRECVRELQGTYECAYHQEVNGPRAFRRARAVPGRAVPS